MRSLLLVLLASITGAAHGIGIEDLRTTGTPWIGQTSLFLTWGANPAEIGGIRGTYSGESSLRTLNGGPLGFQITAVTAYPPPYVSVGQYGWYYGQTKDPLNAALNASGNDRFQFRLHSTSTAAELHLSINGPPPNPRIVVPPQVAISLAGVSDGVVEVPFSAFPAGTNFADVDRLVFAVVGLVPGDTFGLTTISTGGPPLAGDFNRDGAVNGADLTSWAAGMGTATSGRPGLLAIDGNADGFVDGADALIWQRGMNQAPESSPVPEPATWMVSLVITGALAVMRRPSTASPPPL